MEKVKIEASLEAIFLEKQAIDSATKIEPEKAIFCILQETLSTKNCLKSSSKL